MGSSCSHTQVRRPPALGGGTCSGSPLETTSNVSGTVTLNV